MKQSIILFFLFLCCFQFIKGQDLILSGHILDKEHKALPMANVVLLETDSTFVAGTTTNDQGQFSLNVDDKGKFILRVQSIGYETLFKNLDLSQSENTGDLVLKEVSYQLSGVQVTAKAPVVRREADRIIFDTRNVAGSINAVDLLNVTPGIVINGDDISMFSTQGVKFYINGKEQKLGAKEMLQMLKSYSATEIDKIELITSPSAKYAADGKAGIINLKLKKKENNFIGGSVSYAHTQYEEKGDDFNANVLYNKNKLSASVNVGGNWEDTPYRETNIQYQTDMRKSAVDNGLIGKKNYFFKGQLDYVLNEQWTIGAYALYNNGRRTLDVDGKSELASRKEQPDRLTNSILDRKEDTETATLNLNAEQKIGKEGKTIWYNFDYYRLNFDDGAHSTALTYDAWDTNKVYEDYFYDNVIGQTVDNYSGKVDAVLPWGKNRLNVGSHFSYTRNSRQLEYGTALLPDKQFDHFDYNEYVWALYTEYRRKFSDIWSMNLGVRMESTWTKGENRTVGEVHEDSYVRLFPSFFLGYNPSRSHSLNFSVINLVTRPNVNNVNPNVVQRDRYNVTAGNPYLKPSYLYKGNIGYTYNGLLSFDLFYSYQPDEMSNVTSINEDMVRTTRWENCIDTHTLGVNSFYFFNKINWLSLTLIQGCYLSKTLSSSTYTLPEEKAFNYMAVVNMQFFFDSKRRFIGTLSGNFTSKQKTVKSEIDPLYRVDAGVQYNCLNNKLNIGLTCRNLIASKIRGKEYVDGAIMDFNNKFQYMMPRLSVTYNWGARLRAKRHDFESDKMKQRVANDF